MIRWGIAGTGSIATAMAQVLHFREGSEVSAVGSRDVGRARNFAETHEIPMWCQYENLWEAPCDAIYVATPASHHYRHALAALEAGKHVLVEKPFTVNAQQAHMLRMTAAANDLFLMEAAWQRFLPSYYELGKLLADGCIGEIHGLEASFGGKATYVPELRPFRLDLAGGALMDGGIYPIHFAHLVRGRPLRVEALGYRQEAGGVDTRNTILLGFAGGFLASLSTSISTTLPGTATIFGTEGMIQIPGNFTNPAYIEVLNPNAAPTRIDCLPTLDRLAYQVIAVEQCIADGQTSSAVMPVLESCAIMETMDRIRGCIGLRFPDEAEVL